jgi:hypothetical protein
VHAENTVLDAAEYRQPCSGTLIDAANMTDIVERLRERHGDIDAHDASEEIERLRAAKRRRSTLADDRAKQVAALRTALQAILVALPHPEDEFAAVGNIARAALKSTDR